MTAPREIHPQHILEGSADEVLVTGKNARGEDAAEWKSLDDAGIASSDRVQLYIQEDEPTDTNTYAWIELDSDDNPVSMWVGP